jgi:hypothetical protein
MILGDEPLISKVILSQHYCRGTVLKCNAEFIKSVAMVQC